MPRINPLTAGLPMKKGKSAGESSAAMATTAITKAAIRVR
jgi:hypothetical protein